MRAADVCTLLCTSEDKQFVAFSLTVYCLLLYFNDVHVCQTHLGCTGVHGSVRLQLDGDLAVEGQFTATEMEGLAQAAETWQRFVNRK